MASRPLSLPAARAATTQDLASGTFLRSLASRGLLADVGWCGALCLVLLAYYWRYLGVLAPPMYFGAGDFMTQFWPFHEFNVHEWLAGRVPLWNDSIYGGQPHAAAFQGAVFYPLGLVELLAGPNGVLTGMYVRLWLDACIGAIGMYLLVRRLVSDRFAAVLAAAVFCFGAQIVGASWVDHIEALVWLPLTLFFVDRALLDQRPALNAWLAGWAFGAAILGGYPQLWLLFPIAVVGLTIGRLPEIGGRVTRRVAACWSLVAAGGLSLAAVQLAISLEYFWFSDRSTHLGNGIGHTWQQFAGLVVPRADGDAGLYVGAVPLVLAVIAFLWPRRRRLASAFLGLAILGAFLGAGDSSPLYDALFARVGFGLFHGQTRMVALTVFALAVLAGIGLAWLNQRLPAARQWLATAIVLVSSGSLLAVTWNNSWPSATPTVPIMAQFSRLLPSLTADAAREPMRFDTEVDQMVFSANESFRYGLESVTGALNIQIGRTYDLRQSQHWWRFAQLFNVRNIVASRDLTDPAMAEVTDARDGDLRLFKVLYPLPRAYVVHDATVAVSAEDALKRTLADDFDPGKAAIVEQPLTSPLAPSNGSEAVTVTLPNAQETLVDVTASAAGLLVISQPYYPGWQAEVDGRPRPLVRADYGLEALQVDAGHHAVRLFYDPLSFKIGLGLTGLSVVAFLAVASIGRRRKAEPRSG